MSPETVKWLMKSRQWINNLLPGGSYYLAYKCLT